jgi:FAD/FMN-containing dehydrogenase
VLDAVNHLAEECSTRLGVLDVKLEAESSGTEMITEVYCPRDQLPDFMVEIADDFRRDSVNVVYGTIRLIEKDDESFLPWARERYACVIFNLHVEHTEEGIAEAAESFQRVIDISISRGGSYFLTYHKWARRDQVESCYPQFAEFLEMKRKYDSDGRFQSDWHRHYVKLFA